MAWQDELNSLDEELSAGRIRSDEYRRRRDELLAAASSNPVGARPNLRQQSPSIANAFTGDAQAPEPDVTQQLAVRQTQPAKATWETKPPQPQLIPQPTERSLALNPEPTPMQGSEVFGLAVSSPRAARQWPRFVVAIVILALVAGATWWFAFRDKSGPVTAAGPAAQQATQLSVDRLPNPTDVPMTYSGVFTVDQAQVYNLLKPDEAATLVQGGAQRVYFRGVGAGNLVYHTFAYETGTVDAARKLATGVIDRDKKVGMTDSEISGLPQGVRVVKSLGDKSAMYEAVYAANQATIRILVVQSGPTEERQISDAMRRGVEAVVHSIPIG
jgi:hypothetical protein